MGRPTQAELIRAVEADRKAVEKAEAALATAKERRARSIVALYRHGEPAAGGGTLTLSSRLVAELAGVTNPTVLRLHKEAG